MESKFLGATVGIYAPTVHEVDIESLFELGQEAAMTMAYPRISGPGQMNFHRVSQRPTLTRGTPPIREPEVSAPLCTSLSLLIVPGVAFDKGGNRLGYGGGFYDRWLEAHSSCVTIGVAYECCVADKLPAEDHDKKMDAVVTESNVYRMNDLFL